MSFSHRIAVKWELLINNHWIIVRPIARLLVRYCIRDEPFYALLSSYYIHISLISSKNKSNPTFVQNYCASCSTRPSSLDSKVILANSLPSDVNSCAIERSSAKAEESPSNDLRIIQSLNAVKPGSNASRFRSA